MKPITTFILLVLMNVSFFLSDGVSAQIQHRQTNDRPSPKITLIDFNNRVDTAIKLLKIKKLVSILNADHVNIMMCYNTIGIIQVEDHSKRPHIFNSGKKKIKIYPSIARFNGGRYERFMLILEKVNYSKKITTVYPDYQWNRGMGYYFSKLKMEHGGTPSPYAYFEVNR